MKAPNKKGAQKQHENVMFSPSRLHWNFVTLSEQEHHCDDESCCKAHHLVAMISSDLVLFLHPFEKDMLIKLDRFPWIFAVEKFPKKWLKLLTRQFSAVAAAQ